MFRSAVLNAPARVVDPKNCNFNMLKIYLGRRARLLADRGSYRFGFGEGN